MASNKTYNIEKIWDFTSICLGDDSTRNEQKSKVENVAFLKGINFKLIRNIMHQMKSLTDSFIESD